MICKLIGNNFSNLLKIIILIYKNYIMNGCDEYLGSSLKLRNITKIRNRIIQIINNNQEIKRFIKYLTNTPLENVGYSKDGSEIQQIDIEEDLKGENILPISFNKKVLSSEKVVIFCYRLQGDLSDNSIGINTIIIDIICPSSYLVLEGENADRNTEIAYRIIDEVDGKVINSIGTAKVVHYNEQRLSDDDDYDILSLIIEIKTSNRKKV